MIKTGQPCTIEELADWNPHDGGGHSHDDTLPLHSPVLVNLGQVEPKPLKWLWPGRFPLGKFSLIAGEPGLGKSQLTLDMIARITTGNPWPDGRLVADGEKGSAVLLSAEDDLADTIVPRLIAAGACLHRINAIAGVEVNIDDGPKKRRGFSLESDLPSLEQAITSFPDTRLVVVDPISAYMGNANSHKDAEVRAVLEPVGVPGAHLLLVPAPNSL